MLETKSHLMASIKSSRACLHSEVRRVVQRSVKYNFFLLAAPRLRFISDELPGKSKQIKICQKHAACGAGQRAPAEQNAGVWLPNFAPAFFFFFLRMRLLTQHNPTDGNKRGSSPPVRLCYRVAVHSESRCHSDLTCGGKSIWYTTL